MLTRRALAGLSIMGMAGAGLAAQARAQGDRGARRADVMALRAFAETTHPRGREAAANAAWRTRWDRLASEADTLSDGAYMLQSRRAIGWFRDGHTTVMPFAFTGGVSRQLVSGPFALQLPIRVRIFDDGLYVTEAKDEGAALNGARLTRIGALTAVDFMRSWATDFPGSDAWAHRLAPHAFEPATLAALGAALDPAAPLPIEGMIGGRTIRVVLQPRANASEGRREIDRQRADQEHWAEETGKGNYARLLADRRALYVSLDEMGPDRDAFGAFTRDCFAKMENNAAERLVLDLRRNGGGDNYLPEALRRRIERSHFNRPGGLYVLISPATFSAAQNCSTRIERETFALFVGEPTGGRPNHYGDARPFVGEATGITSIVSSLPWFDSYPQDERSWIAPDLPTPATFADWREGRDAALELALTHRSDAQADEWNAPIYFSRPSQSVAWRPFWRRV